jgi:hypothetical protein
MAEKEYIDRQSTVDALARLCKRVCQYSEKQRQFMCSACPLGDAFTVIEDDLPAADVRPVPEGGIGEMSDGYHTFNGLYYQRMILFAALVKAYKDKAWKSHRHEDGELCFGGGWFIVGIDTPEGSYTYHYDDTVWDFFGCEELPTAKHWDGHTEKDVTRLLSLPDVKPVVLCKACRHRDPEDHKCDCGQQERRDACSPCGTTTGALAARNRRNEHEQQDV